MGFWQEGRPWQVLVQVEEQAFHWGLVEWRHDSGRNSGWTKSEKFAKWRRHPWRRKFTWFNVIIFFFRKYKIIMKQNEKSLNSLSPEISCHNPFLIIQFRVWMEKEISLVWKRLDLGTESDFVIEVKPMLRFSSAICHSPSLLLRFLKEIYYLLTKNSKYSHYHAHCTREVTSWKEGRGKKILTLGSRF